MPILVPAVPLSSLAQAAAAGLRQAFHRDAAITAAGMAIPEAAREAILARATAKLAANTVQPPDAS